MAAFSRWIDHGPPYNIVALKGLLSGVLGVNVARVRIRVFELDTGHLTLRLQPLLRILAPSACLSPCLRSKLSLALAVFLRLSRSFLRLHGSTVAVGFSVGVFSSPVYRGNGVPFGTTTAARRVIPLPPRLL